MARWLFLCLACQTRARAMPIIVYKTDHTGPKIQFGGFQDGLFNNRYQLLTWSAVLRPLSKPSPRQKAIEMMIFVQSLFMIMTIVRRVFYYGRPLLKITDKVFRIIRRNNDLLRIISSDQNQSIPAR